MLQVHKKYWRFFLLLLLSGIFLFLLSLDLRTSKNSLIFAALDVGQGDALFIESPTGVQVLIDGGPPRKLLGQLAKVMPPFDRRIDAIVMTHSDADHISGFRELLSAYDIGWMIEPGVATDSEIYKEITDKLTEKNIPVILARRGMRLDLGAGAVIDILFPDRDVYTWETNAASVVAKLSYGETSVILTGDAPIETEKIILSETKESFLKSRILKVGHHGSKTSSSPEFVEAITPKYAVISAGKDNRYGHPHQEVLDILSEAGADILNTALLGTIVMKSDGRTETFSFSE